MIDWLVDLVVLKYTKDLFVVTITRVVSPKEIVVLGVAIVVMVVPREGSYVRPLVLRWRS